MAAIAAAHCSSPVLPVEVRRVCPVLLPVLADRGAVAALEDVPLEDVPLEDVPLEDVPLEDVPLDIRGLDDRSPRLSFRSNPSWRLQRS